MLANGTRFDAAGDDGGDDDGDGDDGDVIAAVSRSLASQESQDHLSSLASMLTRHKFDSCCGDGAAHVAKLLLLLLLVSNSCEYDIRLGDKQLCCLIKFRTL